MENQTGAIFMPPAASTFAHDVDFAYNVINVICVIFFFLVVGMMTYFVIRYRRRGPNDLTPNITHNTPLEVAWTIIPLIIVFFIFIIGFKGYMNERRAPGNALQVYVTAQRWSWNFTYDGGQKSTKLGIPAGRPVEMVMTSQDVLHAFFVPDFRVKQDIVPNRYTTLWFQADQPGTHTLTCAEYCGNGHSQMATTVEVVPPDEFDEWLLTGGYKVDTLSLPDQGKVWYGAKQCSTCHTIDGGPGTGPTWKGIWGSTVKFTDGTAVKVDENYIRESIMKPSAKIVVGYSPVMPIQDGVTEDQIRAIIAYIKTLK